MRFLGSKYARNAFAAGACVCGRGSAPYPAGGAYSAPLDPFAGFKGPTSKGRGGEGREGGRKGKGRKGKGRGAGLTPTFLYPPPPLHIQTVRFFILKFQIDCPLHQLDFINVLDVVAS